MRYIFWFQGFLLIISSPLAGATHLEKMSMEIELDESGARIRVHEYCLLRLQGNADSIPLKVICKDQISPGPVRVRIAEKSYVLIMKPQDYNVSVAEVAIEDIDPKGDSLELEISYEIEVPKGKSMRQRFAVPVLFVDWQPEKALSNTFECSVGIGEGWSLVPVFPAFDWPDARAESGVNYQFDLQVIPAWVAFDVYRGGVPFLGVLEWIDIGMVVILVSLIFYFFQRFKFLRL